MQTFKGNILSDRHFRFDKFMRNPLILIDDNFLDVIGFVQTMTQESFEARLSHRRYEKYLYHRHVFDAKFIDGNELYYISMRTQFRSVL